MGIREVPRVTLVLSGAVSLGTYEAGVLTELIRAEKKGVISIDVVVGSSAGAMCGTLLSFILLYDADEKLLKDAWVDKIDIDKLVLPKPPPSSLLSPQVIHQIADESINLQKIKRETASKSMKLIITRTVLDGKIKKVKCNEKILKEMVYAEHKEFDFKEKERFDPVKWEAIKRHAFASGAFPLAFPPVKIEEHEYVDGGLLNNKPLGLAIKASKEKDRKENSLSKRIFILIQPDPPPLKEVHKKHNFQTILLKVLYKIPTHQSLYNDYKRFCDINQAIRLRNILIQEMNKIKDKKQ